MDRYGDITPVTHHERIFVIFVALTGAVVFSYCMGNISSLILQVRLAGVRYILVTSVCDDYELPTVPSIHFLF